MVLAQEYWYKDMVTVHNINYRNYKPVEERGLYRLTDKLIVNIDADIDGKSHLIHFEIGDGFICDGLSVPKIFRWFLTNWDETNELYNIAGIVHDALYGNRGFCVFSRSECDDIFRGILRESGQDRKHASMADWAVGVFAGSHWGNDEYKCANLCKMVVR